MGREGGCWCMTTLSHISKEVRKKLTPHCGVLLIVVWISTMLSPAKPLSAKLVLYYSQPALENWKGSKRRLKTMQVKRMLLPLFSVSCLTVGYQTPQNNYNQKFFRSWGVLQQCTNKCRYSDPKKAEFCTSIITAAPSSLLKRETRPANKSAVFLV